LVYQAPFPLIRPAGTFSLGEKEAKRWCLQIPYASACSNWFCITTFNIQHSTFNIQHSTFNIQHSTFNIPGGSLVHEGVPIDTFFRRAGMPDATVAA
jgi:hypothetical protein